jgi:hypothetical protein
VNQLPDDLGDRDEALAAALAELIAAEYRRRRELERWRANEVAADAPSVPEPANSKLERR